MKQSENPSVSPDDLRKLFEEKQVTSDKLGEKEKLDYILTTLDEHRGGRLGAVDMQDGVIAFIMGYSESVQGHGVRYLCEYGICKDGKIVSSSPLTYRGAYASEKDHRYRAYNEIKILETKGSDIIFGVKSGQHLLLHKWSPDKSYFETIESYDLVKEAKVLEEEKLVQTLTASWKENIETIRKLISNETTDLENVEDPLITDNYAIFPVIKHDRNYDATDISYKLYIVGDNFPKPHLFHKGQFASSSSSYGRRFFRDTAHLTFKVKDEKSLDLHIDYRGNYRLNQEDKIIPLPSAE